MISLTATTWLFATLHQRFLISWYLNFLRLDFVPSHGVQIFPHGPWMYSHFECRKCCSKLLSIRHWLHSNMFGAKTRTVNRGEPPRYYRTRAVSPSLPYLALYLDPSFSPLSYSLIRSNLPPRRAVVMKIGDGIILSEVNIFVVAHLEGFTSQHSQLTEDRFNSRRIAADEKEVGSTRYYPASISQYAGFRSMQTQAH